jgi:hypothetical protein
MGRTLTNEKGEPVKDRSGDQMHEWLVGTRHDDKLPF